MDLGAYFSLPVSSLGYDPTDAGFTVLTRSAGGIGREGDHVGSEICIAKDRYARLVLLSVIIICGCEGVRWYQRHRASPAKSDTRLATTI